MVRIEYHKHKTSLNTKFIDECKVVSHFIDELHILDVLVRKNPLNPRKLSEITVDMTPKKFLTICF